MRFFLPHSKNDCDDAISPIVFSTVTRQKYLIPPKKEYGKENPDGINAVLVKEYITSPKSSSVEISTVILFMHPEPSPFTLKENVGSSVHMPIGSFMRFTRKHSSSTVTTPK